MLASVDGAIGPADEARIPVTDEGLLRGDGAFEVHAALQGPPVRARGAPRAAAAHLRGSAAGAGPRRAAGGDRRAARARPAPSRACCGSSLTRGGPPDRADRAAPAPRGRSPASPRSRYAPNRVLDGLKTLSYAGTCSRHAPRQGGRLRRGAARHAARPRARGLDVVVLLGPRRRAATRRRWRTGSSARSPAQRSSMQAGAIEEPCTLDDLRVAEEAFIASTMREVQPIAAIDDLQLPAAPGPGHAARARGDGPGDRAGAGCRSSRGATWRAAALVIHVPGDVPRGLDNAPDETHDLRITHSYAAD